MLPVVYPASSRNRTPPNRQTRVRSQFTYDGLAQTRQSIIRAKEASLAMESSNTIRDADNVESDVVIEVLSYLMPVKIKYLTKTFNIVAGVATLISTVTEEQNLTSANNYKITVPYAGVRPLNGTYVVKNPFYIVRLF